MKIELSEDFLLPLHSCHQLRSSTIGIGNLHYIPLLAVHVYKKLIASCAVLLFLSYNLKYFLSELKFKAWVSCYYSLILFLRTLISLLVLISIKIDGCTAILSRLHAEFLHPFYQWCSQSESHSTCFLSVKFQGTCLPP